MKTKLLIGNISIETTKDSLQEVFSTIPGVVVQVSIPLDPKSLKNRGYAIVEMENDSQAAQAAESLHGISVGGRAITCTIVQPPGKPQWYELRPQLFKRGRNGR